MQSIELSRDYLDRLQDTAGVSAELWADLLEIANPAEIRALFEGKASQKISERALLNLSEYLELSPEKIVTGKVDFQTLAAHRNGNVTRVPEYYSIGASSRVRTSAHLFDCVESLFGWRARADLLRRHQITDAILREPDMRINIRFLSEVCDDIEKLGVGNQAFFQMGFRSLYRNFHSELGESFRATKSTTELFEKCFDELVHKYYDQNFQYRILMMENSICYVEAVSNPDICDQLGTSVLGNRLTCQNKLGVLSSLTGYKRLPFSRVREVRCIHHGDPSCVFEIDFSRADTVASA